MRRERIREKYQMHKGMEESNDFASQLWWFMQLVIMKE
jgi:hypothetical protein